MEDLKKPGTMLSIVNTLWLISITTYGYKKFSQLVDDLDKLKSLIIEMSAKMSVGQSLNTQIGNQLTAFDSSIKSKLLALNDLSSRMQNTEDDVMDMQDMFKAIIDALKEKQIDVKFPKVEPEPPVQLFNRRMLKPAASGQQQNNNRSNNQRSVVRRPQAQPVVRQRQKSVTFSEFEDQENQDDNPDVDTELDVFKSRNQ